MDTFTFVGIDINRKAPHITFIAIDESTAALAIDSGSIENVFAYLSGLKKAYVAINAPLSLNQGYIHQAGHRKDTPGRFPNIRNIEFELEELGLSIYHTPDKIPRNDPVIQLGLTLSEFLPQMGFQKLTAEMEDHPLVFFESPANAAFWSFVNAPILDEYCLMGRVQRQLILYDLHLPVENAMDFFEEITRYRIKHGAVPYDLILPTEELNAWMGAFTALESFKNREKIVRLGTPREGLIFLPTYPEDAPKLTNEVQQTLF